MTANLQQHMQEIISVEPEELAAISRYFRPVKYRKRQFIIQENQLVNDLFFVEKGLLKSSFVDESGKEHILQFAGENWWVTDFAAFYKQEKSTLSIDCIEDVQLLKISYQELEDLCTNFSKMEHFFRVKTNFGYVALQQRILSLIAKSAKERYEDFLQQYPDIVQRVPKQLIANYLGLSRETLSRLQM